MKAFYTILFAAAALAMPASEAQEKRGILVEMTPVYSGRHFGVGELQSCPSGCATCTPNGGGCSVADSNGYTMCCSRHCVLNPSTNTGMCTN
ncbi:uncharacterized protein K452DRAFT_322838 [Aplosporella prunicola CBS 121167]|uniref:Uncharacterized protein n=1 Tax=Aplosporella prunicola CBS 121167 TaxID=1176127 RepID=A0A6A6AX23_9PEZI|nr:uncharacterized protein K452DRAFT_322838 [Aplosporella prunicola CBS 121167]KAF2135818.1 hypothetical protein K452DRAFT_322838 [Aplosporella prunicola CBS 121167]